eukprot:1961203-Rhodomonas_salina.1
MEDELPLEAIRLARDAGLPPFTAAPLLFMAALLPSASIHVCTASVHVSNIPCIPALPPCMTQTRSRAVHETLQARIQELEAAKRAKAKEGRESGKGYLQPYLPSYALPAFDCLMRCPIAWHAMPGIVHSRYCPRHYPLAIALCAATLHHPRLSLPAARRREGSRGDEEEVYKLTRAEVLSYALPMRCLSDTTRPLWAVWYWHPVGYFAVYGTEMGNSSTAVVLREGMVLR